LRDIWSSTITAASAVCASVIAARHSEMTRAPISSDQAAVAKTSARGKLTSAKAPSIEFIKSFLASDQTLIRKGQTALVADDFNSSAIDPASRTQT
jgi:hypothetical protein